MIKEVWSYYKKLKEEEKQKKFVLEQEGNWGFLESLIQRVNKNPDLIIELTLKDGTKMKLKTYIKEEERPKINGLEYEEY